MRQSAPYRAVIRSAQAIPGRRWLSIPLLGVAVLFKHWGMGDLYVIGVVAGAVWIWAPDLDEALARVLKARRGDG